uniref:Peptidase S1 domain-containing protein n=1 Tax=Heliothis virescens TaxID=7102 RepID=A0A2A4K292_HELVI
MAPVSAVGAPCEWEGVKGQCVKGTRCLTTLDPAFDKHAAVLGYGEELSTAWWSAGGTILSEKYILTAAFSGSEPPTRGPLTFVALDVKQLSDPPSSWQTHKVKRFIPYPEYRFPNFYHDIALIEMETLITFNKNVLPACLPVVDMNTDDATALTWRDEPGLANESMGIDLNKFTYAECSNTYVVGEYIHLKYGIDTNTQMCYGSRRREPEVCMSRLGEALLVWNQFCGCIPAVIGVTSFSLPCEDGIPLGPSAYTRVAYYIPWIESIVWP